MLTLVLAESALEMVPDAIKRHPAVKAAAARRQSRPQRTLLDASLHHTAMEELDDAERRGRPDLVHFWLLLGLDSVLNKRGDLRLLVHTRNDELIRVDPETRIMRNYPRFVGLMEQLFLFNEVPKGKRLLTLEDGWSLRHVLEKAVPEGTRKVALAETGRAVVPHAWVREQAADAEDVCLVLGGFPKGGFQADVPALVDDVVAFGAEPLTVWTTTMEVIAHWEAARGTFEA